MKVLGVSTMYGFSCQSNSLECQPPQHLQLMGTNECACNTVGVAEIIDVLLHPKPTGSGEPDMLKRKLPYYFRSPVSLARGQ